MNKFKIVLEKELKKHNLSQIKFAEKMNVTQQCVSAWLQGSREPRLTMFIKICEFFELTPNELLGIGEQL